MGNQVVKLNHDKAMDMLQNGASNREIIDRARDKTGDDDLGSCTTCNMPIASPLEYHPYVACVLYREFKDAKTVRVALNEVIKTGRECKE